MGIFKKYNEEGTQFRNLKFPKPEPFITEDINDPKTGNGSIASGIIRRTDDVARLTKFLASGRGIAFLANQQALDKRPGKALGEGGFRGLGNALLDSAVDSLKLSAVILGQAAVNNTGVRLTTKGKSSTYINNGDASAEATYSGIVDIPQRTIDALGQQKIASNNISSTGTFLGTDNALKPTSESQLDAVTKFFNSVFKRGQSLEQSRQIQTENDGGSVPNTTYNTDPRSYTPADSYIPRDPQPSTGQSVDLLTSDTGYKSNEIGRYSSDQIELYAVESRLAEQSTESAFSVGDVAPNNEDITKVDPLIPGRKAIKVSDFRSRTGRTYTQRYSDNSVNLETRVNLGNPGTLDLDRSNYENVVSTSQDRINMLDVLNNIDANTAIPDKERDLIKFRIKVNNKYLIFRAAITSFSDGHAGSWNSYNYIGRGEKFYTYASYERSLNLGFRVAAQSRAEMYPLYRKLNYLISATAPTYSDVFMKGTICEFTIGDYMVNTPAIITTVNTTWDVIYPWEIRLGFDGASGTNAPNVPPNFANQSVLEDKYLQELPMVIDVNLTANLIHNFVPKTGLNDNFFITNGVDPNKNWLSNSQDNENRAKYLANSKNITATDDASIDSLNINTLTSQDGTLNTRGLA